MLDFWMDWDALTWNWFVSGLFWLAIIGGLVWELLAIRAGKL